MNIFIGSLPALTNILYYNIFFNYTIKIEIELMQFDDNIHILKYLLRILLRNLARTGRVQTEKTSL